MGHTERFTGRAAAYQQYRLSYPAAEVMHILRDWTGLRSGDTIADIGAGTGMLTELFLNNGNPTIAIEPNAEMRAACAMQYGGHPNLTVIDATAEATTLPDRSVDLIAAGRAFHWFDHARALPEFRRILKPGRWVALVSIGRAKDDSPLSQAFESLLTTHGTDYPYVRDGYRVHDKLETLFPGGEVCQTAIPGEQKMTLDALTGQAMSYSMAPLSGDPRHAAFIQALGEFFRRFSNGGLLTQPTTCWINCCRFAS
ncbi:class I SAM-dependent methyltransferase [Terriglobus sp. 2YAB30_2]|uniref:class I SAM-dependent methyltransferase n=1 Tax=unclassified Terriglobus TaxID=2628988 RepID=UPI003F94B505